jgi:hypothetical protein
VPRLDATQLSQYGLITPMRHRRREGTWFYPTPGRPLRVPHADPPPPARMTLRHQPTEPGQDHGQEPTAAGVVMEAAP